MLKESYVDAYRRLTKLGQERVILLISLPRLNLYVALATHYMFSTYFLFTSRLVLRAVARLPLERLSTRWAW